MKYNDINDGFVLKNISFKINGGEKIGCVGRTGAGKSSFVQVLFRMVEPTKTSSILIDGVNVKNIGLRLLRRSMAIIPQTAFTFIGSVKYNLDPLGKFSDKRLWIVLE